jgi:Flp pilus assembly protein TadD
MKCALAASILAFALAGCAVAPGPASYPRQQPASGSGSDRTGAVADFPERQEPAASVTSTLIAQSHEQRDAGNLGGAAATIERALTIAPEDALLWVELGEIRMAQGDIALAEEMARKALTLTPAGSALAARAQRLLSR